MYFSIYCHEHTCKIYLQSHVGHGWEPAKHFFISALSYLPHKRGQVWTASFPHDKGSGWQPEEAAAWCRQHLHSILLESYFFLELKTWFSYPLLEAGNCPAKLASSAGKRFSKKAVPSILLFAIWKRQPGRIYFSQEFFFCWLIVFHTRLLCW